MPSHPLTLGGPFAVAGHLLVVLIRRLSDGLFLLMILFLCRLDNAPLTTNFSAWYGF